MAGRVPQTKDRPTSHILSRVREARAQSPTDLTSIEDYLEVIHGLVQEKGYARSIDISKYLGVKSPSVTNMLQRLHKKGFLTYERYRGISLTPNGTRLARSVIERHLVIARFLRILGVDENTANLDAEGIEHHVHGTTIDRIAKFVNFVADNETWFEAFQNFSKTND